MDYMEAARMCGILSDILKELKSQNMIAAERNVLQEYAIDRRPSNDLVSFSRKYIKRAEKAVAK